MSAETREFYGEEYIAAHLKAADVKRITAAVDISPVLEAMTDGLLAISPKKRFLRSHNLNDVHDLKFPVPNHCIRSHFQR